MVQRKLRLMLTFEGDPVAAVYLLDEWPEGLLAHAPNPTIPVLNPQPVSRATVYGKIKPLILS